MARHEPLTYPLGHATHCLDIMCTNGDTLYSTIFGAATLLEMVSYEIAETGQFSETGPHKTLRATATLLLQSLSTITLDTVMVGHMALIPILGSLLYV